MVSRVHRVVFVGGLLVLGACGSSKPASTPGGSGGSGGSGGGFGTDGGAGRDAGPAACNAGSYPVQFAQVTGTVAWNGARWPNVSSITLTTQIPQLAPQASSGRASPPFWSTTVDANGTFSVRVPFGQYDVQVYDTPKGNLFRHVVAGGVKVEGDTQVAVNLQTVKVSGTVTLAGAAFPAEDGGRGELCFRATSDDNTRFCSPVSDGARATYAVDVPRGYQMQSTWARAGTFANTTEPGTIPYGSVGMGTFSFDDATTVDMDVKTPSYLMAGRLTVDGGPVPPAPNTTVAPAAQIALGTVTITIADGNSSSFRVRMVDGLYLPYVTVPGVEVIQSWWNGCAAPGCLPMRDNNLAMNVATTPIPRGTIEGKLDFQVPAGRSIVPVSGGVGQVTLALKSLASGSNVVPFHGYQTSYVAGVDNTFRYTLPNLPYGTYTATFQGGDAATLPNGIFPFAGTVVVDRASVTWNQVVPLAATVIDVKVNGQPMADDSILGDASSVLVEPRGQLVFTQGETQFTVSLGEVGPARFERLMIPGRYQVAVDGHTTEGRTYVRGYMQDVLPVGRFGLGTIDIVAGDVAAGAAIDFDLAVRDVRLAIPGIQSVTTTAAKVGMVSLTSADGNAFWTEYPLAAEGVDLRVYSGCYAVQAFPNDLPYYPADFSPLTGVAQLGQLCTCDGN